MIELNLLAFSVIIFIVITWLIILNSKEFIFEPNPLKRLVILELVAICLSLVLSILSYFNVIQILYPKNYEKEIWLYAKFLTIIIYCNAPVPRNRFIIINSLPSIIFGFFPFVLWVIGFFDFNSYLSFFIMIFSLGNIVFNIGILIKSLIALTQAPENSTIRNYGFNSYWY